MQILNYMDYFNYHARAKNKIREGKLVKYEIVDRWKNISPALVLFFDDSKPIPIRSYKWNEYIILINETYAKNN